MVNGRLRDQQYGRAVQGLKRFRTFTFTMEKSHSVVYVALIVLLTVLCVCPVIGDQVAVEASSPPRDFDTLSEEKRIANEGNAIAKQSLSDSQTDEQATTAPPTAPVTEELKLTSDNNDSSATESPTTPEIDVKPTDSGKTDGLSPEEVTSEGSNTTVIIVVVLFIFTNLIKGVPVIISEVLMRKARTEDDKDFNSGGKRLENDDSSNSLSEVHTQASGSSNDLKKGDSSNGISKASDYNGIDNVAFTTVIVKNGSADTFKSAMDTRQSARARKQKVLPLEPRELYKLDIRTKEGC